MTTTSNLGSSVDSTPTPPIRVAARPRSKRKGHSPKKGVQKRYVSPLFDDRGYPNPQDDWDAMLPEVKACRLTRKPRHNPPTLQGIDPNFGEEFDEAKHGQMLKDELNILHLSKFQQNLLLAVIKKY